MCESLGFTQIGKMHQHQGAAFQPPLVSLPPGERLRPIGVKDTPWLIALASRATRLDRATLLPQLLDVSSGIALDRDGELIGFVLFRRFGHGHVIGPVVAPESANQSRAKALISYWLALNAGVFVRIDTPERFGLSAWLERLGLPQVECIAQMAPNGPAPSDEKLSQFALANQGVWRFSMHARLAVFIALLAAALFGAATPVAKVLLGVMSPFMLAGLFYLGSGVGLGAGLLLRPPSGQRLHRAEIPWLLGALVAGGVAGPARLMLGLSSTPVATSFLLLNLEGVLTAVIAWVVFKENVNTWVFRW